MLTFCSASAQSCVNDQSGVTVIEVTGYSMHTYAYERSIATFLSCGGLRNNDKSRVRFRLVSDLVDRLVFRTEHDVSETGLCRPQENVWRGTYSAQTESF